LIQWGNIYPINKTNGTVSCVYPLSFTDIHTYAIVQTPVLSSGGTQLIGHSCRDRLNTSITFGYDAYGNNSTIYEIKWIAIGF